MNLAELPNRRVEAWKYSDLRSAVGDARYELRGGRDIIERLAPETVKLTVKSGEGRVHLERL
ncbi:MAG TPA: hypothetical protein VJ748_05615, partial [Vitreimonas sp.]|nr:hypothetical protein [Vitreimonas sp.]